ncbi:MAG: polysaccharide deacetylase family protein [Luteitalea sp.]|nr:polysaccharide deacetylase family protein [Luteitalea sp.]
MNHLVAAALRCAGIFPVATLLARRSPRILMYHRFGEQPGDIWPGAEIFERQIRYLRSKFHVLSLAELTESLVSGRPRQNAIVLTIDDGYEDFYKVAYPVLRKYDVPATLYVATDFIDGRTWLWPDIVAFILQRTARRSWTSNGRVPKQTYDLAVPAQRRAAWSGIGTQCVEMDVASRTTLLQALAMELDVDLPPKPTREFKPLNWAQLREMAAHGIEIASHSCSHARLTLCTAQELEHEMLDSKRRIEEMLDRPVRSFCYPFGKPADVNAIVRQAVVDAGYRNAVVAYSDADLTDDLFGLRRFSVGADLDHFRRIASGASVVSAKLRRLSRVASRRPAEKAAQTREPMGL